MKKNSNHLQLNLDDCCNDPYFWVNWPSSWHQGIEDPNFWVKLIFFGFRGDWSYDGCIADAVSSKFNSSVSMSRKFQTVITHVARREAHGIIGLLQGTLRIILQTNVTLIREKLNTRSKLHVHFILISRNHDMIFVLSCNKSTAAIPLSVFCDKLFLETCAHLTFTSPSASTSTANPCYYSLCIKTCKQISKSFKIWQFFLTPLPYMVMPGL